MFHACFTWLGIILPSPHCFHRCNQFSKRSTQICHCFPILFPLFYVIFPHLFIVYPKFQTYGIVYPKIWAKTELLHITCVSSPHIETAIFPLLFHYAIMVPHRSLNFTWHHFTLSLFFPPFFLAYQISVLLKFSLAFLFFPLFYIIVSHFFHCFSHHFPLLSHFFPIVLYHIPSFFPLFFSSFSPPLQSPQVHLGGRTRGESIPHRHPIATWYITLKNFTCGHLFYHLFSRFLAS